jgi:hypothetical protein
VKIVFFLSILYVVTILCFLFNSSVWASANENATGIEKSLSKDKKEIENVQTNNVNLTGYEKFSRYSLYWSIEPRFNLIHLELKENSNGTNQEVAYLYPANKLEFFSKNSQSRAGGDLLNLKISADFENKELKMDGQEEVWKHKGYGGYRNMKDIVNQEFENKTITTW